MEQQKNNKMFISEYSLRLRTYILILCSNRNLEFNQHE